MNKTHPLKASRSLAHDDFFAGLSAWRLWLGLGVRDIRTRYKRTFLGPLWITLGTAATFTSLGMLFSAVLKNDVRLFLPYLAAGMVSWNMISAMAGDGPRIFVDAHHLINSLRLPLPVHVMRCVVRNAIIFFHNILAAMVAFFVLGGELHVQHLLLFAVLPLFFAVQFGAGLILAILGARFRDLGPIIGISLQFCFFMTPIIWSPNDLPLGRKWWVMVNPLHHLIELVRAPMLGSALPLLSVVVSMATALTLVGGSYMLFRTYRRRISYWI